MNNVMSMWHIDGMLAGSDGNGGKGGKGGIGKGGETKANERHQLHDYITADVRCVGVVHVEVAWQRSGGGRVSMSMGYSLGLSEGGHSDIKM